MQKIAAFIIILSLSFQPIFAQQDLGIHFMNGIWQSTYTNPAFLPDHKFTLSLPGIYNNLSVDNFTYSDLIDDSDPNNTIVNFDGVIDKLGSNNIIRDQADIPTAAIGIRFNKAFFSVGHSFHFNAYLNYPKELVQLVWNGNAQFIGQTVDIAPELAIQAYSNLHFGLAGEVVPGLILGGRLKLYSGIGDISTSGSQLQISTDDDVYQTRLAADYTINNTGIIEYNGFNDSDVNFGDGNFGLDEFFTSNYGLGFDFGAQLKLKGLTLAASIVDWGAITWRDEVQNNSLKGDFEYQGLDLIRDALLDTIGTISIVDTLEALFEVQETNENYSSSLPTKFYLSGQMPLSDILSVGALVYLENYQNNFRTHIGLGANAKFSPGFSLGAMYSLTPDEAFRLGVNSALKLGPIQLVLATDNVLTAFQLENSNSANFRLGLNLVFGKIEGEKDINAISNQDDFFR